VQKGGEGRRLLALRVKSSLPKSKQKKSNGGRGPLTNTTRVGERGANFKTRGRIAKKGKGVYDQDGTVASKAFNVAHAIKTLEGRRERFKPQRLKKKGALR